MYVVIIHSVKYLIEFTRNKYKLSVIKLKVGKILQLLISQDLWNCLCLFKRFFFSFVVFFNGQEVYLVETECKIMLNNFFMSFAP